MPSMEIQAESPTATLRPESVYITVTYIEPINVRSGPNSVYYPVVGMLPIGATAPALGRSLAGEWVQILFPEASDGSGVGWVYVNLVTISAGVLHVIEPPPTVMPSFFVTLNPAYAISLQPEPTNTRAETFTPPSTLSIPTYTNAISEDRKISPGVIILFLGWPGIAWCFDGVSEKVSLISTMARKSNCHFARFHRFANGWQLPFLLLFLLSCHRHSQYLPSNPPDQSPRSLELRKVLRLLYMRTGISSGFFLVRTLTCMIRWASCLPAKRHLPWVIPWMENGFKSSTLVLQEEKVGYMRLLSECCEVQGCLFFSTLPPQLHVQRPQSIQPRRHFSDLQLTPATPGYLHRTIPAGNSVL